ncbi:YqaA family protein [Vibrio nitrifigilis]|uniref:DedA family protein n=1 Tax=Vibrio nitrifigilis TaxID=2789781 RepID=A0ABS0GGC6_9VIBR|nr:YqaA family protein [Vibrio nitrifigilis]MBF9001481.1 DedA family protein [Vibrio nitrifigilis]
MLDWFNSGFSELWWYFSGSALWVLFFSGFLSATLLPGGSEAAFIATLSLHQYPAGIAVVIATVGNTLGGLTNYLLGRWLPKPKMNKPYIVRSIAWLERYGYWALLLSWLPVIGDPLCLAAGWLRVHLGLSTVMIALGKALRYGLLAALYLGLFSS